MKTPTPTFQEQQDLRPTDPGIFQVTVPTERTRTRTSATLPSQTLTQTVTAVDIANQKSRHDEKERQYYECQAVEQALRNQIVNAIGREYLDALQNTSTDMINKSILEIMEYLQQNYREITIEELSDLEDEVKRFTYDLSTPVDSVFNKLNNFQDLCILSKNEKTDKQLCHLAYLFFNRV